MDSDIEVGIALILAKKGLDKLEQKWKEIRNDEKKPDEAQHEGK